MKDMTFSPVGERFGNFRCIFILQPFKEIKEIWKVENDIMFSDKVL